MITILISTNIMITLLFMMMNHPLSSGFMLLIQTIIIALLSGNLNQNMWFSYILFLIMVGGMLILFMYMTSIASNEKFKTNLKSLILTLPATMMSLYICYLTKISIINNESFKLNLNLQLLESLNKYINFPLAMITLFMMMYLLLALIATVKITNFKQGSIRQMN